MIDNEQEWDPNDPDTKGEMVFVYRSDLIEYFGWLSTQNLDHSTLNPRQAEALAALMADMEA